ncbi:MAG: hypothetical protein ACP5MT_00510 [Candidatus Acidifodinimicrobium sp.]
MSKITCNVSSGLASILDKDMGANVVYHTSNEDITPAEEKLKGISGLGRYVGISGGFTANLYILSKLQKNNKLAAIDLVDTNPSAIFQALELMYYFNSTDNKGYRENLDFEYGEYFDVINIAHNRNEKFYKGFVETNLSKPELSDDLSITFHREDIFKFLDRLESKDKYFIYLSNLFDYKIESASYISSHILENDKIESGSWLLLTAISKARMRNLTDLVEDKEEKNKAGSSYAVGLFRKEGNRLKNELIYRLD